MKPPGRIAGSGSISRLTPQLADRPPKILLPGLSNVSTIQNSNRECERLEIAVTQRKQRIQTSSNRELEAHFSASRFDRTSGPRRGAGLLRPRFGTGCWFGGKEENSTATEGGEHLMPPRAGGEPPPLRRKGRGKRTYAPPGFVAIKPEADRLFCISYRRF
jgi:hypothetical protein